MPYASLLRILLAASLAASSPSVARARARTLPAAPASARAAPSAPSPTRAPPDSGTRAWMLVDSAARTVKLTLVVTRSPAGGAGLINGYLRGAVQIVVPLNWTVEWGWRNADSTSPHSLVVMAEREKIPTEGGRPAFANALTRMETAGLPAGQVDQATFTADQAGWYWMLCAVPGHALAGEWIGLRVDPDAKTAYTKLK